MDEVWCGLDLQLQADGIHAGPDLHGHDHDPFWSALAECAASFLASDADDTGGLVASAGDVVHAKADGMDTSSFFADNDHHGLTQRRDEQQQQQPVHSSSSLSSKRSLSIDSGGSSSSTLIPPLDGAAAAAFSPAPPQPQDPFAGDDEAIMLAMMAVISSASPSSSESSSPPHRAAGAGAVQPRVHLHGGDDSAGHVTVRTSSLAVAPTSAAARQQDDACMAAGSNNSSQVYHMISERKRREKLNDSFHTLRSLLPPCSKKDKTTVLTNAASYLKALEAQVSELEEKNAKLERHVPRDDGGGGGAPESQSACRQGGAGRAAGERDGDGDGGVRHRRPGAARPGVPPVDGRGGERAVRRRRHLLAAGDAQGARQHQAAHRA
uniref:BHLH domain-containing protein n=1 Tax=Zea mays TaxID=4577 RepID=A0A804NH49_MAIZE